MPQRHSKPFVFVIPKQFFKLVEHLVMEFCSDDQNFEIYLEHLLYQKKLIQLKLS